MAAGDQSGLAPSGESASTPESVCVAGLEDLVAKLYEASESSLFGISLPEFTRILNEILRKYCEGNSDTKDRREVLLSLKVGELALARACAAGNEHAWEVLLTKYRGALYEMACGIAKDDVLGKELADSLYADLYGISARGEQGPSKLNSYSGIGSLMGWLRTVMVQGFIDRKRTGQRLTSLDEEDDEGERRIPEAAQQPVELTSIPDPRLSEVTDAALATMTPEDRYIVASYYLDRQTLTELSGILSVHESTISRRLEKITQKLRKTIRVGLLKRGMSAAEVEDALQTDVRDLELDVRGRLKESAQKPDPKSFFKQRASTNRPQGKM
jgi:RNA polymerase sigma-70 factor, ECF subfamily